MSDIKWDRRLLELAKHISTWSKDPSTQVGAVVALGRDVLGVGYNGFPKGVNDDPERYNNRELKYKLVVHAEVNALLMAGRKAKGATIYVYPTFFLPSMCNECCKVAIQSGIREVVGYDIVPDPERAARWAEAKNLTRMMLEEAGIIWRGVVPE